MERLKIGHALGKDAENATYLGPSFHSTTNLCCSMTRSRWPSSYFIKVSSWAQSVSSKLLERGTTGLEEKRPIQRNPEMMRVLSDSSGKLQMDLMCATSELQIQ